MERAVRSLFPALTERGSCRTPQLCQIYPPWMRKSTELLWPVLGNRSKARPRAGKYPHTHPRILHILSQRPGPSRCTLHSAVSGYSSSPRPVLHGADPTAPHSGCDTGAPPGQRKGQTLLPRAMPPHQTPVCSIRACCSIRTPLPIPLPAQNLTTHIPSCLALRKNDASQFLPQQRWSPSTSNSAQRASPGIISPRCSILGCRRLKFPSWKLCVNFYWWFFPS